MKADTMASGRSISGDNSPTQKSRDLKAIYTSADEKRRPAPDEVMNAINACRELNADVVAIELSDRTIIAAVNGYDDTYAAAVCDPGVGLPAVSRSLQVRLFNLSMTGRQAGHTARDYVRRSIGRWERKIAVDLRRAICFRAGGCHVDYAESTDAVTIEDLETMRRKLSSAIGDCIDLSAISPE